MELFPGCRRPDGPITRLRPGDYQFDGQIWWLCAPNGALGRVTKKEHNIIIHNDTSITINPSIIFQDCAWHGALHHGVWRDYKAPLLKDRATWLTPQYIYDKLTQQGGVITIERVREGLSVKHLKDTSEEHIGYIPASAFNSEEEVFTEWL